MKKNLRNILALSLGLMTTVAFAQDWGVDSRTRIDMSGDNDKFEAAQRATVGTTWGGSDWSIHASTEVNYDLNSGNAASLSVYEAYASTDLMGYASVTMGRQALEYGSGVLIGKNDWGNRVTRDAMIFGLNLDVADVIVGYSNRTGDGEMMNGATSMYFNASKSEGDWNANLLYGSDVQTVDGVEQESVDYMGLDLGYNMMGGALGLMASFNQVSMGSEDADMTTIGATYQVNDAMSVMASQTTYGEYSWAGYEGGNLGAGGAASWMTHGNIGLLSADAEMMTYGGSYAMGDFNLGVAMYNITDANDDSYERDATEFNIGYSLNDNSDLSLKFVTDNDGGDTDINYTWLTVNIGL